MLHLVVDMAGIPLLVPIRPSPLGTAADLCQLMGGHLGTCSARAPAPGGGCNEQRICCTMWPRRAHQREQQ